MIANATAINGTLAQAAALFPNVTSFNWKQTITFPSEDTVWVVSPTLGTYQVSNTVNDPAIENGSFYQIRRVVNGNTLYGNVGAWPVDGHGFYYDVNSVDMNSSTFTFEDTPSVSTWALNENSQGQPLRIPLILSICNLQPN